MASFSRLDVELGDFAVHGGVGHQHGLAAHGAILDIRLLGYRQVESQIDGLPAMWTRGVLALQQVHRRILNIMAFRRHSTWAAHIGLAAANTAPAGTLWRRTVTNTPRPLYFTTGFKGRQHEESWSRPILRNLTISIG